MSLPTFCNMINFLNLNIYFHHVPLISFVLHLFILFEQGQKGYTGQSGYSGDVGLIGDSGEKGQTGTKGIKGRPGENGEVGETGEDGFKGRHGFFGTNKIGRPGNVGRPGKKYKGLTGYKGFKGNPSSRAGQKGERGATGPEYIYSDVRRSFKKSSDSAYFHGRMLSFLFSVNNSTTISVTTNSVLMDQIRNRRFLVFELSNDPSMLVSSKYSNFFIEIDFDNLLYYKLEVLKSYNFDFI